MLINPEESAYLSAKNKQEIKINKPTFEKPETILRNQ